MRELECLDGICASCMFARAYREGARAMYCGTKDLMRAWRGDLGEVGGEEESVGEVLSMLLFLSVDVARPSKGSET